MGHNVSSALVRQLVEEQKNFEFKPVKLRLKIDLVSYPSRVEGLVNMIIFAYFKSKLVTFYSEMLLELLREDI